MKKVISLFMALLLVVTSLVPSFGFSSDKLSAAEQESLTLNENLTDWIMDKENNQIYAITSAGNLHFISLSTFSIEKTLDVGTNPTDIDLDQGQLYVSFGGTYQIKTVDMNTRTILNEFMLTNAPHEIAVDASKLFYVEEDQHTRVYSYVYGTDTEEEITLPGDSYTSYYEPDLSIDKENDTLYIGESGTSGGSLDAISTSDYSIKSQSTYDDSYGFPSPGRSVLLDSGEIFYAGSRLDASNLERIKGTYFDDKDTSKETVIEVEGNYVFTNNDIFERMTFQKKADLPFETEYILANGLDEVYMFNQDDQTIYKISFTLPQTDTTTNTSNNRLLLNDELTDWEYDSTKDRIYAVSQNSNNLYYIDPVNLVVENQKFVGSMPSDIDLVNDQLYVANKGGTTITLESTTYEPSVTNDVYTEPVDYITTSQNPYKITTDGSSLFYATEDTEEVFNINLSNQSEEQVLNSYNNLNMYSNPDLELDSTNNKLYIGESGSSGSNIYTLDATNYSVLDESTYDDGYGFEYPNREVILDGNDIYYAKHQINKDDLTSLTNSFNSQIVYTDNNYVYTENAVYDRNTNTKVADFPCPVNLVTTDSQGRVFVQPEDKPAIYRFDSVNDINAQTPTNFTAQFNENNEFILDWDTMTADNYTVEYSTSEMDYFSTLESSVASSQLEVSPSEFKPWFGSAVTFRVTTNICDLESQPAQQVYEFVIHAPDIQQYTENNQGQHLLTWDAVPFMEGYHVYYKENETESKIDSLYTETQANVTDYVYGEWQGKTLQIAVASTINGLDSDRMYNITETFDVVPPKNLKYNINDQGQHILSWNGVPYTDGYKIYYKEKGTSTISSFDQLVSGTQLDITDKVKGEWQGKTMQFAVTSSVGGAESSQTFDVTQAFDVYSPENLKLSINEQFELTLAWDANPYADSYNIYYKEDESTSVSNLAKEVTETQYNIMDYVTGDWSDNTISFAVTSNLNGQESSQTFSLTEVFGESNDTEDDSSNDSIDTPDDSTENSTEDDSSNNNTPVYNDDRDDTDNEYSDNSEEEIESKLSDDQIDQVIEHILENEDGETTTEIEVEVFDKDIFVKRTTTQPIEVYEYQSENNSDYVDFSISKSFIDSANEEDGEEKHLYIKSNSGSYQLPLDMTDFKDISENAKVEVSIRESSKDIQESISRKIEGNEDLKLISRPMDFEVNIVEEDTVTTIESFGTRYVERSVVLDREVDADKTLVVTYNEETDSMYTVPARIEVDEDGNTVAIFNRNGNSTYAVLQMKDKTFKDTQDHWAKKEIESLASQLIIEGRSNGNFDPEANVTRAEYAVLLTRAMGLTPNKKTNVPYEDVSKDDWYFTQLQSAMQANLLGGFEDENFKPNQAITREELMELTARALTFVNGKQKFNMNTLTPYHDAGKLDESSLRYVAAAIQSGIIQGTSQQNLLPKKTTTRAESAVVLKRLMSNFYFNN